MADNLSNETIEMWISAYLDGELNDRDQESLFMELEKNPELSVKMGEMAAFVGLPSTALSAGEHDAFNIANEVMLEVAPQHITNDAPGGLLLCSSHIDGELSQDGQNRLFETLQTKQTANAVATFSQTAQWVGDALSSSASHPFVFAATENIVHNVEQVLQKDERAQQLLNAAIDGELATNDAEELDQLANDGHLEGFAPSFLSAQQGIHAFLQTMTEDPMAKKAGDAALAAIAAFDAQGDMVKSDATGGTRKVDQAGPSLSSRIRDFFGSAFVPITAGAAALAVFFMVGAPEKHDDSPGLVVDNAWVQNELASLVDSESPDQSDQEAGVIADVLGDNAAEIETIDSGSQVAAVFNTEAHNITVIWIPEPEEG